MIAGLELPDGVKAVLWDLDGVQIDSLEFDLKRCPAALSRQIGRQVEVPEAVIRKAFPLPHKLYWEAILEGVGISLSDDQFAALLEEYEVERGAYTYTLHKGVRETLQTLKTRGIRCACVSSNETALIHQILASTGLADFFELVVGLDAIHPASGQQVSPKPAPDMYLTALHLMNLDPAEAWAIEDSVTGATAALGSGCFTVAVATGSSTLEELKALMQGRSGTVVQSLC